MESIRVKKATLIEILQKNRNQHRTIFTEAQKRYRERVIEELDRRLDDAKSGRRVDLFIHLPTPEDHTEDFDRVIKMLELSLDDEVKLSEADARKYVQNVWEWQASFASNTTSYLAS